MFYHEHVMHPDTYVVERICEMPPLDSDAFLENTYPSAFPYLSLLVRQEN